MAPPLDPNQSQSQGPNPGQNQPIKVQVDKLKFEDLVDVEDVQTKMNKIFKVSDVVEKEEKKSADIHLKYLKLIQTAERHKHTLLVQEKEQMIKLLKEEMVLEKNKAMGSAPHGPERVAAGQKVEADFATKIADLQRSMAPKENAANLRAIGSEGHPIIAAATEKLAGFIELLPKFGIAMYGLSSIVTGIIAVLKLGMDRLADLSKLQADLRAGGMGLNESGRSVVAAQKAFMILGQDMEVLGQSTGDVNRLVAEMSKSPDVLKELVAAGGPEAWKSMRDAAGEFGVSIQDTAEMVVSASKSQNLSMVDVSKMFVNASHVAKMSNMNFKDAFNSLLGINAELRNMTFNSDEARKVFTATAFALRNFGDFKLSQVEAQKFAASIAGAIGGMTVEKMTGVMAFVKGRMPTEDELAKGLGLDTLVEFMNKAMGNDFKGPQALIKISKLMEELGIQLGSSPIQGAKAMQAVLMAFQKDHGAMLQKVLDDNLANQMTGSEKQAKKAAEDMKQASAKGLQSLTQMVAPLDKLATAVGDFANKFVDNFMPQFSSFANNFDKFVKMTSFDSMKNMGGVSQSQMQYESSLDKGTKYNSTVQRDMTRGARARARQKAHLLDQFKGM